jgi:hypothetical protein
MNINTERSPARRLRLVALALSLGFALFAWNAGHAHAKDSGNPDESPAVPISTATALDCSPTSVEAGQRIHCVAAVTGRVDDAVKGEVIFKSEDEGSFSASSCVLSPGVSGQAAFCGVDYVPAAGSAVKHRLHAYYRGNADNEPSQGDFVLTFLGGSEGTGGSTESAVTTTAFDCTPASVEAGGTVHCVAAVTGLIGATEGEVVFGSSFNHKVGGFFSAPSCKFESLPAFCGVDYITVANGDDKRQLHASYRGDAANDPSQGDFVLTVLGDEDGGSGGEEGDKGNEGGADEGGETGGGGSEKGGGVEKVPPALLPMPNAKSKAQQTKRRVCKAHCGASRTARSSKR